MKLECTTVSQSTPRSSHQVPNQDAVVNMLSARPLNQSVIPHPFYRY